VRAAALSVSNLIVIAGFCELYRGYVQQIAEKEHALTPALNQVAGVAGRVSMRRDRMHAGHQFDVAVERA